jgi:hypothetical protein
VVLAACLLAGLLAGCSSSRHPSAGPSTATPPTSSAPNGANSAAAGIADSAGVRPPPAGQIYLGLFDNAAAGSGSSSSLDTYDQLTSFEAQIGRKMAIDMHYSGWKSDLVTTSVTDDLASGRIPLISWQCGDTDANVIAGRDDALIENQAKAIAALRQPVMIRWFWEMEFTGSNGGHQGSNAAKCIGSAGPEGYAAAWRHIVGIFRTAGATNVSWVFCPGQDAFGPKAASKGRAASAYYPGNAWVDWIGEDAYSRAAYTPLPALVRGMYSEYGTSGKPLMLCETGAEAADQPRFLASAAELPGAYPAFKAMVYFNSHGPLGSYVLTDAGISAFAQLARSPAFSAMPAAG